MCTILVPMNCSHRAVEKSSRCFVQSMARTHPAFSYPKCAAIMACTETAPSITQKRPLFLLSHFELQMHMTSILVTVCNDHRSLLLPPCVATALYPRTAILLPIPPPAFSPGTYSFFTMGKGKWRDIDKNEIVTFHLCIYCGIKRSMQRLWSEKKSI